MGQFGLLFSWLIVDDCWLLLLLLLDDDSPLHVFLLQHHGCGFFDGDELNYPLFHFVENVSFFLQGTRNAGNS